MQQNVFLFLKISGAADNGPNFVGKNRKVWPLVPKNVGKMLACTQKAVGPRRSALGCARDRRRLFDLRSRPSHCGVEFRIRHARSLSLISLHRSMTCCWVLKAEESPQCKSMVSPRFFIIGVDVVVPCTTVKIITLNSSLHDLKPFLMQLDTWSRERTSITRSMICDRCSVRLAFICMKTERGPSTCVGRWIRRLQVHALRRGSLLL